MGQINHLAAGTAGQFGVIQRQRMRGVANVQALIHSCGGDALAGYGNRRSKRLNLLRAGTRQLRIDGSFR